MLEDKGLHNLLNLKDISCTWRALCLTLSFLFLSGIAGYFLLINVILFLSSWTFDLQH